MSALHLDELALEALANDREDLVDDALLAHLDQCAECAMQLAEARALSIDAAVALRHATPAAEDLDVLIAGALERAAPEPVLRPSRRALAVAAAVGALVTAGLGVASMPSLASVVAVVGDAYAFVGALDRVVTTAVPFGWSAVTLVGFLALLLLAMPLRALVRGMPRLPGGGANAGVMALGALLVLGATWPGGARALELEGEWPEQESAVSESVPGEPATEALRAAAESVGLGLAATLPDNPDVTLHVRDASLRDVVEAVLGDAPVVVRRTESMLIVRPVAAHTQGPAGEQGAGDARAPPAGADDRFSVPADVQPPAAPGSAPAPPELPQPPSGPVDDRVTFGGDVVVRAGERVGDVLTMGGDAEIEGEVMGDVVTAGGDVEIRAGGSVRGDVVTMGGDIDVLEGAVVHGELATMGGEVTTAEGASVRGDRVGMRFGGGRDWERHDHDWAGGSPLARWLKDAMGSAAKHALLFLLGVLLLALAPARLGALQRILVKQPVRSGVSGLLGFVGTVVLVVVLSITIIGIPAAVIVGLGAAAAVYIGLVAISTVLGAALPLGFLKDRPLLQLATGVVVLFLASLVPVLGTIVTILAASAGFGSVLLTRFRKYGPGEEPV